MKELISAHLISVMRRRVKPNRNKEVGYLVRRVAGVSVAAAGRVHVGDILHTIDGAPANQVDWKAFAQAGLQHSYIFYSPEREEERKLTVTGVPLGLQLQKCETTILDAFAGGVDHRQPEDLLTLWENGSWLVLQQACNYASSDPWMAEPASLLLGAAKYEQGDQEGGMALIEEFAQAHARRWTANFTAISFYYAALEALGRGDEGLALERLEEAWNLHPHERVAHAHAGLSGHAPKRRQAWIGCSFPVQYILPTLQEGEPISLMSVREAMQDGQLLVVCLLPGQRANGPYGAFLEQYLRYATHLGEYLADLHVVTTEAAGESLEEEEKLDQAGLEWRLLHDSNEEVIKAMHPFLSPSIFFLDRGATVVMEGHFQEVAFWELLARGLAPDLRVDSLSGR